MGCGCADRAKILRSAGRALANGQVLKAGTRSATVVSSMAKDAAAAARRAASQARLSRGSR